MPDIWALLVGSNFYFTGSARSRNGQNISLNNLSGCVRDVDCTFNMLRNRGVKEQNISKLTASTSENGERPIEPPDCWPTFKNIQRKLVDITKRAQPGDIVYFHYSGHGVQRKAVQVPQTDADPLVGMALVMTDVLEGEPFLTGYHLGLWIRGMAEDRNLRCTVILDSCHSGEAFRNAGDFVPRDITATISSMILQSDKQADREAESAYLEHLSSHNTRNSIKDPRPWLLNPKNATIITACDKHETAGERTIDGIRQGVLTHNLLHVLRDFDGPLWPSHSHLLHDVRRRIRNIHGHERTTQTPLLYGDGNIEVLGTTAFHQSEVAAITPRDGKILIEVGACQGAAVGSIYDLLCPAKIGLSGHQDVGAQARVEKVDSFSCTARLLDNSHEVDATWRAALRYWAFHPDFIIAVVGDEPPYPGFLDNLREKLRVYEGLRLWDGPLDSDNQAGLFLETTRKGPFRILDKERNPVARLPSVQADDTMAPEKLAYTLSHLARYHRLLDLSSMPAFQQFRSDRFILDTKPQTLRESETLKISYKYLGPSDTAWISIFCFNASWGIDKIEPEGTEPACRIRALEVPEQIEMDVYVPNAAENDVSGPIEDR
ncbi:hypothetical protein CGLO_07860 [Colletotrichum gloeosporioides Cg-14]|uniref:Peptidase C14 caspase domain-containing protein n=1 Tax=Colletotrichum gloeosporioides (strain Cg-14) TaxID=1237896 RepID=T0LLF9_COLGC|nr:hypothetical protein CGLO_07860 [Colletotrichum gloeosporioides Cg-14]